VVVFVPLLDQPGAPVGPFVALGAGDESQDRDAGAQSADGAAVPGPDPQRAVGAAARAFEAFYTTKEPGKGTGLGLDIAKRIVIERHGGTITIDSRPCSGRGSSATAGTRSRTAAAWGARTGLV
jgi:hypothetical protein